LDSGFTIGHFDLLERWGGKPWTNSAVEAEAREELRNSYVATRAWAEALRYRLFSSGYAEGRMAVINQGKRFSPYNWWRIYPSRSAPRSLTYTVGIDASRQFIVKIDTYQVQANVRASYDNIRGETFALSPITAVKTAEEGVALSFEQLIDWSAAAINTFAPDYNELARLLGLTELPVLTLVDDPAFVKRHMEKWRDHLLEDAVVRRGLSWIAEGPFVLDAGMAPDGRIACHLGTDTSGNDWLVEINEPRIAGSHDSLSGVAVDGGGRPYLLRQGVLRRNSLSSTDVNAEMFAQRTGMIPVLKKGLSATVGRDWFLVAALDEPSEVVRAMTAQFVNACALARSSIEPYLQPPIPTYTLGADEKGGTYLIRAPVALDERVVTRQHGLVWLALKDVLKQRSINLTKPHHRLGFEVDGVVLLSSGVPLLLEIKTSITAGDLHTGVGQLHLYRKLINELAAHCPILLLPRRPDPEVTTAIVATGVAVHFYTFAARGADVTIDFSREFLIQCGVEP
jgi:hypothetical protein